MLRYAVNAHGCGPFFGGGGYRSNGCVPVHERREPSNSGTTTFSIETLYLYGFRLLIQSVQLWQGSIAVKVCLHMDALTWTRTQMCSVEVVIYGRYELVSLFADIRYGDVSKRYFPREHSECLVYFLFLLILASSLHVWNAKQGILGIGDDGILSVFSSTIIFEVIVAGCRWQRGLWKKNHQMITPYPSHFPQPAQHQCEMFAVRSKV